jgi:hypothetical protein
MNAARLKWIVLMIAFAVSIRFVSGHRTGSVREYATSAQLYSQADRIILSVNTTAEVRNESIPAKAVRKVQELAKLTPSKAELHSGATHIYTLQNGTWQNRQLGPGELPEAFRLWPYNGKLYTWDESQTSAAVSDDEALGVMEWRNGELIETSPELAAQLHQAFPNDPANYLAAGEAHPYDVVQDAITRDEWHAYTNLAAQANGTPLAFAVGDKTMELMATRGSKGELSFTVRDGSRSTSLWQAQAAAHTVSRKELAGYLAAPALSPTAAREPFRIFWREIGWSLLGILVVSLVFVRPLLLNCVPESMQFVDANENEFPKLDRDRWNDCSQRLAALGFVHVRDFKLANMLNGGISRLYLHPETNCYANIFQVFAPNAPGLLFGFMSYIGEDWTVGHGTLKPMPSGIINRLKHTVSFARPGRSLEELYREHVAKRDEISAGLGLAVVPPLDFETYQQRSDLDAKARREVVKRSAVLLAAKVYLAKLRPLSNDWWGDYPKEIQERTGQNFVSSEA